MGVQEQEDCIGVWEAVKRKRESEYRKWEQGGNLNMQCAHCVVETGSVLDVKSCLSGVWQQGRGSSCEKVVGGESALLLW